MAALKYVFLTVLLVLLSSRAHAGYFVTDVLELRNNTNPFNVETVRDINVFRSLHPDVGLEELNLISNVKQQLVYTLGTRLAGDRLVAHGAKNQSWPSAQNVQITLTYPNNGLGALVTYVYIVVNQSSSTGRAYVTKGGIHQRFITVVIEAYGVTFMNIDANIYGMA